MNLTLIRNEMRAAYLATDNATIGRLAEHHAPCGETRARISTRAQNLVDAVRSNTKPGMTEAFLCEYGLSTEEGVAIMTLAEALLRVPDRETKDVLIEDKTTARAWMSHSGKSDSQIVNMSTLALSLTGQVLAEPEDGGTGAVLRAVTKRLGVPVIRSAVGWVMRQLGHQFVLGETIQSAIKRAKSEEADGYTYSYDMLGEAALTAADAEAYYAAYETAIHRIGKSAVGDSVSQRAGISVKLSALHPRYEFLQGEQVIHDLSDRLATLCALAAEYNIGLNVDAEEADRLDLSLDIIEAALMRTPSDWDGFGVVVQAYGKRAGWVIDWLYALAERENRKFMVRLVKGAYWDTEIKQAQVQGLDGFPVFSTKASTDVSYICCASKLLGMRDRIYPQFATHNAHTVAAVMEIAGSGTGFEFQRLHGMGEALHDVNRQQTDVPCRIYAPVGSHKELLAYLVRRLLENGANSSFVNQIVNKEIPSAQVVADPFDHLQNGALGTALVAPNALFAPERRNSIGMDVQNITAVEALEAARTPYVQANWHAHPLTQGKWHSDKTSKVVNPADQNDVLGFVQNASIETVTLAISEAKPWSETADLPQRQHVLNAIADLFEEEKPQFAALLAREAGKTLADVDAEVREAVDFLRYYAAQAAHHPNTCAKGVVGAISPWNFPLAIFVGQISAALAAGNAVVAKPAEQTPITAFVAIQLMHRAGVPVSALQLLPGLGAEVGAAMTSDPNVDAVCFTGSTNTAQIINQSMADTMSPDASLLAETGGLNAMIVDSTALPEQAIKDIVASAFQSAGQRCSALRVLYVQEDIAEPFLKMLMGAMEELTVGNPLDRATDVGPVIDAPAKAVIDAHVSKERSRVIKQIDAPTQGTFVGPTLIEIDTIGELETEIFGPVLHVCRFKSAELTQVVKDINATGYALTFGLHSRIESRVSAVTKMIHAGNVYVNRNQIGAVVGSQPFGGEGLSGTGPKAGGPRYLTQFLKSVDSAQGSCELVKQGTPITQALIDATKGKVGDGEGISKLLPGPTGEENTLTTYGRGVLLCLGPDGCFQKQKAIAESLGSVAILGQCDASDVSTLEGIDGVVFWGDEPTKRDLRKALAGRKGAILPLVTSEYALSNLVREQHTCIDITAAGGNASLLAGASA